MTKVSSTEEWQTAVKKHIDKLTNSEERYEFAHKIIFDIALWTGYNNYEIIGLIECIKQELLDAIKYAHNDCDGDCENCDRD